MSRNFLQLDVDVEFELQVHVIHQTWL